MNNNRVVAYSVIRITEVANINCGMILDFIFIDGYVTEAKDLLKNVISIFKKNKIGLVGCLMSPQSEETAILKNYLFFKCPKKLLPQPFPIILRQFGKQDAILNDFSKWFFTMGDYDAV